MKKNILKITFSVAATFIGFSANAQCPTITCPPNITVNNDNGNCDAIVTYTDPVGFDACGTGSQTFTYTGAQQMWVVPAGVTSITVDAYGAQGGSNWVNNTNFGGYVQADIAVTPGSTLYVYVGEQPTGLTGGFNGGGNGESGGAGGGGASDIRIGGVTLNDRVIVAGGAGGAGYWSSTHVFGGIGGGLIGGPGYRGTTANPGGDPGTQTASGNGTCVSLNNPAVSGGFGFGGAPSGCGCEGYGGGGGWYGGAGSGNCRGGGGGSSYTIPAATNVTHTQGVRTGNGEITISYTGASVTTNQIAGLTSGSVFPVGTTTNTFYASNTFGNDTCSFTVTVNDTEIPTISCPSNVVSCVPTVNNIAPTAADNCSGETVTYTLTGATTGTGSNDASGSTFNQGITTVKYIVTDASGNKDSCSFNVEVLAPLTGSVTNTICNTDSVVVNGTTYNASNPSGTEVFSNVGPNNCDSTVTINLNVLPALTGSVTSSICNNDSIVVNGTTYNAANPSGTEVFSNVGPNNCDSTVTINLNVLAAIDVTVTNTSPSLTSNENGATYQWLDCDNNFSIIAGATSQTFNASVNGNYAVEVTVGNCVDTSACESVNNVGINKNDLFNGVSIFPNPTNNIINITLNAIDKANLTVYTIDGKVVYQNNNITEKQVAIDLSNNSKGIYFLKVEAKNQNKVYKIIKE